MSADVVSLLDEKAPGFSKEIAYSFLSKLYSRGDAKDVYEVVYANKEFTKVMIYRTDDLGSAIIEGVNRDFTADDKYVQCNPGVQVIADNGMTDSVLNTVVYWENSGTLLSFIQHGSGDDYYFIMDEVAESDGNWNGPGVALFSSVRVSKSTMSIFVPNTSTSGFVNQMIAVELNNKLTVKPFYYAIPVDCYVEGKPAGDYYTKKVINGSECNVYYVKDMEIFQTIGTPVVAPLINQAALLCACYDFAILAMNDLLREHGLASESMAWAGGSKAYTSQYCIELVPDLPKLTSADRYNMLCSCIKDEIPAFAGDIRVRYLMAACKQLEYLDGEDLPTLTSIISVSRFMKHERVTMSMYLATVRYYAYCSHRPIVPEGMSKYISGGMLEGDTLVKEGFK